MNDLKDSYPEYYIIWKREISNYQDSANFIISDMNMGIRNYDTKNYIHPCVRASWILERISRDSGINFLFPANIIDNLISKLLVPMLTKEREKMIIISLELVMSMTMEHDQIIIMAMF